MFGYYLKLSAKVVWWHLLAQFVCALFGVLVFGMLSLAYRGLEIFSSIFLSVGYVVFMYSKLYKVGERDTKSYVQEKPYACKGMVISILLLLVSVLWVVVYNSVSDSAMLTPILVKALTLRLWGYSFSAFFYGANGSISIFYWILYFVVPFVSCAFGYFSGMHRWEIGYVFFKHLVFKKKK